MRKHITPPTNVLLLLFFLVSQFSIGQIFVFNFENTTNVTTNNSMGTPSFASSGVSSAGYNTGSPCQGSRMYTANNWDNGDYHQFTVNTVGYQDITFSFCHRTDNTSVGTFIVRVSSDGGDNWTTVRNSYTPGTSNATITTNTFPASAENQPEVLIQIYKTSSPTNARTYLIDSATLTGTAVPAITNLSGGGCAGSTFTITGVNFTGVTGVAINGTAVASYTVNSSTSITATVAQGNVTGVVSVTNANGTGTSSSSLSVNPSPSSVSATPSATTICAGSAIDLTASATPNSSAPVTLLSENFNAATNSWTTSGTPAAAWTLRADGYSYSTSTTVTFHSNDDSQFYMSNSDTPGSGSTTSTTLQSPSFSTVGLSSAALSFHHFYRYWDGNESGNVEISTNGTTWASLAQYTSTQGSAASFANPTLSLNAYLNQPTVYIRFRYAASYDYYWLIDNVSVTGVSSTAATYAWTSTPAGFTSSLQNPTNVTPTANTTYTVTVTNSYGCSATATTVTVNVNPVSVGGSISGATTVCSGTNSTLLTLSGNTGTIQWQSSPDNSTWTNIGGATSATYTATNLTATTYYRAVVTSGICAPANSASVAVTVNPVSVAGSISGATTVCAGINSTVLTLSGYVGTIQWQSSVNNISFNNIIGATSATYTATNLSVTTYYRAVVTNGVCSSATTFGSAEITVNPTSVAGSISGATTVCSGINSTVLTLVGNTGNIQWQSSPDNSAWANILGATTPVYTATNLTANTYYRAVVTSGLCASANSASVLMTVTPASVAGTIDASHNVVCAGTNSTLLTLTGNTGTIQWQSSSDDITFANIPGATGQTYTANNLSALTFYRVVVTNGICSSATSVSIVIDVTPASVAGTISGGGTVCAGGNAILSLSGNTGTIQWQSSPDNSAWTNIGGATSATYDVTNVTGTVYYRAVVTSGVCSAANTASVSVGLGNSTTWNGTSWSNGTPTSVDTAYITGNYTSASNGGSISACSLTVDNNAVVVISTGDQVSLNGALVVNPGSSFTLENNANLLQATDVANTGSIIVKRNSSALKRLDYTLWSSPVAGQELLAFSPATVANRFYTYNTGTNLYNAITPAGTNFEAAKGYLIRMPNNHPTFAWTWNGQFAGVPHNGPYSFTMADGGTDFRFNLVGNPYPSPISIEDFVAANASNITGTLYFWRKTNNSLSPSYCSWAAGTFISDGEAQVFDPQGIIRTGQGFFVEGNGNGSSVVFNNSMRINDTDNQFFRQANTSDKSRIWLNATNEAGAFSQMALVYVEGAMNDAVDMFDGRYINDGDIALNSMIGGVDYVIQGRAPFVPSDMVPLSFKATTAGSYSISIDHLDGLFAGNQNIYLKDNMTGAQHDLKAGPYMFTCEAGTSTGRFEVIYQLPLGTPHSEFDENHVVIYKQDGMFVINTGSVVMDNVQVFDIRGRMLLNKKDINASQTTFDVSEANQVLIVKVTSDTKQTVTKKVVN